MLFRYASLNVFFILHINLLFLYNCDGALKSIRSSIDVGTARSHKTSEGKKCEDSPHSTSRKSSHNIHKRSTYRSDDQERGMHIRKIAGTSLDQCDSVNRPNQGRGESLGINRVRKDKDQIRTFEKESIWASPSDLAQPPDESIGAQLLAYRQSLNNSKCAKAPKVSSLSFFVFLTASIELIHATSFIT